MADTKLSALTETTTLASSDEIYVNDGGASRRAQIKTLFGQFPLVQRWISGQYYFGHHFLGDATANVTLTAADRIYASPFILAEETAIDRISIAVTTGAAGNARLGIYYDDGNGNPGALLVDGGTVDVSSVANVEVTISQTLAPGQYWTAMVSDVTPGLKHGVSTDMVPVYGWNSGISSKTSQIVRTGFSYAALPDPFGTVTLTTGNIPAVAVRAA